MKRTFVILAAIATLCSCNKEITLQQTTPSESSEVTIRLYTPEMTKAGTYDMAMGYDNKINDIQVLVFNQESFDAYASAEITDQKQRNITVRATKGERTVYVCCNCSIDLTKIRYHSEMKKFVIDLTQNTPESIPMIGSQVVQFGDQESIDIEVTRAVARIKLGSIFRNLPTMGVASIPTNKFIVNRVFLVNAVNNTYLDKEQDEITYKYTNEMKSPAGCTLNVADRKSLIKLTSDNTTPNSSSMNLGLPFYCGQNKVQSEGTVNNKTTYLVIECLIDDKYYTYPIELGPKNGVTEGLLRNVSYDLNNLTISRMGNISDGDDIITEDELQPLEVESFSFNLSITPWNSTLLGDKGSYAI